MYYNRLLSEIESRKITDSSLKDIKCRFSPCPNGYPTLGHVKSLVILDEIRNLTGGLLKLRFDDTNPNEIMQKSYLLFLNLLKDYSIKYDEEPVYCSKQLGDYIDYAKILYTRGEVFFCKCKARIDVKEKQICNCDINYKNRNYEEVSKDDEVYTLKYKSSREDPYVLLRKINRIWYPTIAFQGPIDDYKMGINLIVRGTDLISLEQRQKEIHNALFKTEYPLTFYWGRISIWDSKSGRNWSLSKTKSSDNCVMPNLNYFYYWNYTCSAISEFLRSYGFTKNDIKVDIIKLNQILIKEISTKKLFQKINKFQDIKDFYSSKIRYYKFKIGDLPFFGCLSKKPITITSRKDSRSFGKRYVFLNYCNNKYYLCPPL